MKTARNSGILRAIPLLVTVCFVSFPAQAQYGGGMGEPNDPYLIYTAEQMNEIGADANDWDKHFKLMADIDLAAYTGTDFNIIGRWFEWNHPDNKAFSGVFDGNDKTIHNFTWASAVRDMVGLFAYLRRNPEDHTVKNLGLENVNIRAENGAYIGVLAARNEGSIANCYVTGYVSGEDCTGGLVSCNSGDIINCYSLTTVEGNNDVGGLVGSNNDGDIDLSFSHSTVSGGARVGGLVGTSGEGDIRYCYSSSTVSGLTHVGGLVGLNSLDARIIDCYASGSVAGTDSVGGIVGTNSCDIDDCEERGEIQRCYSTTIVQGDGEAVGGLVGWNKADIISCFWDTETSGMDNMCGDQGWHQVGCDDNKGKTIAEMQMASTFFGWGSCVDETTWTIDDGNDYPRLWWENQPGEPIVATLSGLLMGSGTEDDPYLIYTAEELNLVGLFPCDFNKHFKLMADIDLTAYAGTLFNIIGEAKVSPFHGVFDGNCHTISNFSYSGTKTAGVGFFGYVSRSCGEIKNLGLIHLDIDAPIADEVGVLVGSLSSGSIVNCYVQGGSVSGRNNVGGLVGINEDGTITNCYAAISVFGEHTVGGLVGYNDNDDYGSIVTSCYTAADVTGADDSRDIGGLVGINSWSTIRDCYATGSITAGASSDSVGGLVGTNWGTISNCYSAASISAGNLSVNVGGLIGLYRGRYVICSYWDVETSGLSVSGGGNAKTTAELNDPNTFVGWNPCGEVRWTIEPGKDYPRLVWENGPGIILPSYQLSDFLTGTGAEDQPHEIFTTEQFQKIGRFPCEWNKHFILMADIDLSAYDADSYHVIGVSREQGFTGLFDGNGHVIRNLSYAAGATWGAGIFGYIGGDSHVKNLGVENATIVGGDHSEESGILAGANNGTITNCYVTGSVTGGDNSEALGGLIGENWGTISNCYASGNVSAGKWSEDLGGLAGWNHGTITYCYAAASVTAGDYSESLGGLVGLFGRGKVFCSYWDVQASGLSVSGGGSGKTTAELMNPDTFIGWNSCGEVAWTIEPGQDYPRLIWENRPGVALPSYELSDLLMGSGTEDNPYEVFTAEQFERVGRFPCEWDKHFVLMEDIDLSTHTEDSLNTIGISPDHSFTGLFDGNGHVIRNPTYRGGAYGGTFGYIGSAGCVRGLSIDNITVTSGDSSTRLGGLAGYNEGNINECYVTGSITAGGGTSSGLGGLVGENSGTITNCRAVTIVNAGSNPWDLGGLVGYNNGTVADCSATGTVTGGRDSFNLGGLVGGNSATVMNCHATSNVTAERDSHRLGGLIGDNDGTIINCYATASVNGVDRLRYVGGLVGENNGTVTSCYATANITGGDRSGWVGGLVGENEGTVTACYATGIVSASSSVGGLVGSNRRTITNSYSTVSILADRTFGGLIGNNSWGEVIGSFWDTERNELSSMCGVQGYGATGCDDSFGRTTVEMQTASTFLDAGWDFVDETENGMEDIWDIFEGVDYPKLVWELNISTDHPDYNEWLEVGEPICWCYSRQCHGDADYKAQGKHKYWVSTNDLDILIAAWNKPFAEIENQKVDNVPLICADFDHKAQGTENYRVSTDDLDILIANWNQANAPAADCP
ncbi:MAG: GLUG motif-containing protein [Planctomycetota bacterium]|jgi:hypothetical protein